MITTMLRTITNSPPNPNFESSRNTSKTDNIRHQYESKVLKNVGGLLVNHFVNNKIQTMVNTNPLVKPCLKNKLKIVNKVRECPLTLEKLDIDKLTAIPTQVEGKYKIVSNEGFKMLVETEKNHKRMH